MTPDEQIQECVIDELRWIPDLDDSNLGVEVRDGIVILTGFVATYPERLIVECAAKRVRGVRGIANEVRVSHDSTGRRADAELVRECLEALRSRLPEAAGALKVLASDAHLTLEGAVASYRERQRVENTARAVAGVASVHNLVAVDPDAALQQDSRLGASVIAVRGPDRVQ